MTVRIHTLLAWRGRHVGGPARWHPDLATIGITHSNGIPHDDPAGIR
jgi:hypothetical protein